MVEARVLPDDADLPFSSCFEVVPDATVLVDRQGIVRLANDKACELFGWSRAELVGAKVERLLPPRFAAAHEQHRERFGRAPRARPMGIELALYGMRRDGTEFPLEIALNPFTMGAVPMVVASIRDLTNTLRFRDAAKGAHYSAQVVRLGELALRSTGIDQLLGEAPKFIVESLRADIVVIYWAASGAGLRPRVIHGVPAALAETPEWAAAIDADGMEFAANPVPAIADYSGNGASAPGAMPEIASSLRVPLRSRAGLVGLIAAHTRQANRFGEEELHFLQAVGNVIVEALMRGEAEAQLAHAQRLESIGQLTGGIAHDFNNILTVVLGNLQMLHDAVALEGGSGFVKLVESAQRASRRGANLTQKLLTFSRKQSLAPSAIELPAMLGAVTDMLQRTMGEAIRIEWEVAPDCPPCLADAAQLDNAIVNLALNARDAMEDGGRLRMSAAPLTIVAGAPGADDELAPGTYVVIAVEDSGQGMPPEVLRRAYEPFFTTKPSGKGSGLGLSMVYGFAKQSGGTVRMESEPGKGTLVRLFFPAADGRANAARPGIAQTATQAPDSLGTLLVVDDDPEVLEIAEGLLAAAGYRVLPASGIAEALHWLAGPEPISLLFTDVVLGEGETGPQLAAAALKVRPGLPVLYTSGFAHGSLSVADVRPVQFLAKPYHKDQLIARIATLLAEAREARRG
ncbi:MAG: PAS domain S-box protein [Burkholderiales bacterium]|nr:PAS domain S-box protein [Burkholderiales bacterium]